MTHHKTAIREMERAPLRRPRASSGALLLALAGAAFLACAGPAERGEDPAATALELDAEADALYRALRDTAAEHQLPMELDDPELRHLSSEWIAESPDLRRRYHLAVIHQPRALAIRVHIVRQARITGEVPERWEDVERSEDVVDEENQLLVEAYLRWQEGDDDDHP